MLPILKTIDDNSSFILAVLCATVLILGGFLVKLASILSKTRVRFTELLNGDSGSDLETLLVSHAEERAKLHQQVLDLAQRLEIVERKLQRSKRHVGIVRYDAFGDISGQQSFALALYDDNGDGAVLTSIIGRAESRVYGKPIFAGKSDRNLTNEEQQAIVEAVSNGPKSLVSAP